MLKPVLLKPAGGRGLSTVRIPPTIMMAAAVKVEYSLVRITNQIESIKFIVQSQLQNAKYDRFIFCL